MIITVGKHMSQNNHIIKHLGMLYYETSKLILLQFPVSFNNIQQKQDFMKVIFHNTCSIFDLCTKI